MLYCRLFYISGFNSANAHHFPQAQTRCRLNVTRQTTASRATSYESGQDGLTTEITANGWKVDIKKESTMKQWMHDAALVMLCGSCSFFEWQQINCWLNLLNPKWWVQILLASTVVLIYLSEMIVNPRYMFCFFRKKKLLKNPSIIE